MKSARKPQSFMDSLQPKKRPEGLKEQFKGEYSTAPAGTAGGNRALGR